MTTHPVSAPSTQFLIPPSSTSDWKSTVWRIAKIALQALIPFFCGIVAFYLAPAAWTKVAVPIATIAGAAISFFCFQEKAVDRPLPPGAPRGLSNGGANCWVNALFQMLHADKHTKQWLLQGTCPKELLPFQEFIRAYDTAYAQGLSVVGADSQTLRTCLATLMPQPGIGFVRGRQEDPTEGWMVIHDRLPAHFKARMRQVRNYTARPDQPSLLEVESRRVTEIAPTAYLSLAVAGQNPSLATLMDAHCNAKEEGGMEIGGEFYAKTQETLRFLEAPPSLWLHFKRFTNEERNTSIDFPLRYNLQLQDATEIPYELVSFTSHSGNPENGHYVSYRKGPGDGYWYQMNDQSVERVSVDEMRSASRQAYFVHYSRRDSGS